ncbi:MAG: cytochrome c3 family protein [Leptospiraceae bacterium]|nr:cytochrome c3 family protein [Leptospiraceae bacterium]
MKAVKSSIQSTLYTCFLVLFLFSCKESRVFSSSTCLNCHSQTSSIHTPEINCSSCHLGDEKITEKEEAHKGMVVIPGNLDAKSNTCANCHPSQTHTILHSPMTRNKAMIEKNRRVFGEANKTEGLNSLKPEHSAADSYFAGMCASCHLGISKTSFGMFAAYEKGGGCLACHLSENGEEHLRINRYPTDETCFNCHSRSGRISLSYKGLFELTNPEETDIPFSLPDGRVTYKQKADLHYEAGLSCIECHGKEDVMGDGKSETKTEAVKARCTDCHKKDREFKITLKHKNKVIFVNAYKQHSGHDTEHDKLSCETCHSQKAPQCYGCHISYEPEFKSYNHLTEKMEKGKWIEEFGEYRSELPVLGKTKDGIIRPFVPGMKLSIDTSKFYKKSKPLIKENLFSPLSPHTSSKSRTCKSCHQSPYALGYGSGKFQFDKPNPVFRPDYALDKEEIAEDGWIKPFQALTPNKLYSTADGGRPLNPNEQRRILQVGSCFRCHKEESEIFQNWEKSKNYQHLLKNK